jgi:sterol 3beta-glucosyltransferase
MRIILATYGTTGDVQPMLALGVQLARRGHSPVVAAAPNFGPRAESCHLEFLPLGPHRDEEETKAIFAPVMRILDPAEQLRLTLSWATCHTTQMFEELRDACRQADALLSLPFQFAGHMVHQAIGIPLVSYHYSPFFGRNKRMGEISASVVNSIRSKLGLPSVEDPLGQSGMSTLLTLIGVSRHFFPRLARWPEWYKLTGFWYLDQAAERDWAPDPDLVRFVDSHQPLVVVTTGSMYHDDPQAVGDLIIEALHIAGCGAIVQQGFSGLTPKAMTSNVRMGGFVPHSWLLPKAACIVHIGGSGVAGATLRAGVPSVVIPHWQDQHLFGYMLKELGCAGAIIPFAELTAQSLGAAIRKTLHTPSYAAAAKSLGAKISAEDGVRVAAELIEEAMHGRARAQGSPGRPLRFPHP